MYLSVGIMVLVAIVVITWLVLNILRFRDHGEGDGEPAQVEGNGRLELTWTIIPAILILILAVPTLTQTFRLSRAPASAAAQQRLQVNVTGHQWWWGVEYPEYGFTTANEIHIPAGTWVDLQLTSADVIHSLWVPKLSGKTDLVPGRTNSMPLYADEPGVYSGQCAEFCGTSHTNMHLLVIVQSPADFQAWVEQRQHPATTADSDLARQGEQIFAQRCAACHTVDGTPYQGSVGPNLTGVGSRTTIAGATVQNTDANLRRWLNDPPAVKPGAIMPRLGLTNAEIDALTAYLRGLR